jgi:putative SOS response-associated peptidase YedK
VCGRYTLATPADELIEAFDVDALTFDYVPRYNIAPGQDAPIVAQDNRGRRMGLLRWGFVPARRGEPGSGIVNARCETVAEKPSFRDAYVHRRCLVPADGFYEWQRVAAGSRKQPYWIHPVEGGTMSFAAIWEKWQRPGAEPRHTFAILTTDANDDVSPIHDRMPVIVSPEERDAWLDRSTSADRLRRMLLPAPAGLLGARPVSTRVNRVSEEDPDLIRPLPGS